MNKSELKDHEYQCGSKTIICEFCNQGVPKMEYDLHLQYTCNKKSKKDKHSKIELKNENKINISPNKDLNYKPIKIINNCSENSSSKKIGAVPYGITLLICAARAIVVVIPAPI